MFFCQNVNFDRIEFINYTQKMIIFKTLTNVKLYAYKSRAFFISGT